MGPKEGEKKKTLRPRKLRQPDTDSMTISIMSHMNAIMLKIWSYLELYVWARSVGMLGEHMHDSQALAGEGEP